MDEQLWRRAEALVHATLEREPEGRAAFLDAAYEGDEALRRQVELSSVRRRMREALSSMRSLLKCLASSYPREARSWVTPAGHIILSP